MTLRPGITSYIPTLPIYQEYLPELIVASVRIAKTSTLNLARKKTVGASPILCLHSTYLTSGMAQLENGEPVVPFLSAAFFCPQTKAPDEAYLVNLHAFLKNNIHGRLLLRELAALADSQVWETFASARHDVRQLDHGPRCLQALADWASSGASGPLSRIRSNISSLPLLTVLQAGQYLRYLEAQRISHQDFVSAVQKGAGVHGYCGGLPSAISIACADDEADFVRYIAISLRILVGIGAYTEAADEEKGAERTLLAVRLQYEGQGDDLIRQFPGAYLSGITGPRAVSIGGSAATINKIYQYISDNEGLRAEKIDLGGSAHDPKNKDLAAELCLLCRNTTGLQLPDAEQLHTPVRTNQTGKLLQQGSLTDDLIHTMLSARCEWYDLLINVAQDLKTSGRTQHNFAIFGWADCVTMNPFHQARLKVTKTFAKNLIQEESESSSRSAAPSSHHLLAPLDPQPTLPENSVAIVGASCRLPGANDMSELWSLLARGESRVEELPRKRFDLPGSFRASQSGRQTQNRTFYGNFIDGVENFDHGFFGISAREAANMDPQQRIMLELSFEALEDAGYLSSHNRMAGDNVGCFVGLVLAEYMDNTNAHGPTAYTSTGTVPAFLCGRLSHTYGWSGPSEMFNTACSSSLVAINRACKAVQTGECRMALAGGVNIITGVNNYLDLAKAGFLSPTGQCKPFDSSGDGYCRADGAGLVVLKTLKDARQDGDTILGVIPSISTNQSGLSSSITSPSSAAQQRLYEAVIRQSGLDKNQITYVEAHGTGTQVGDPIEMESIRSVFSPGSTSPQHGLHIGSIKGNIGHSEPAAGVAGLLKVLTMLRHGEIPPQPNFSRLNPKIPPLDPADGIAIPRALVPWNASFRAALVNSYGAAGSNAALVCCDQDAPRTQDHVVQQSGGKSTPGSYSYPLLVSASSTTSLVGTARKLGEYLDQNMGSAHMRIQDLAFTLNQKRQHQRFFVSIKVDTVEEAAQRLRSLSASDMSQFPAAASTTASSKPVILAFSGQTGKTIGLPRSLYDSFPAFRFHVDACDAEFQKLHNASLLPSMFSGDAIIEDTTVLQCGIFAAQYACARCWLDAGVQPRAVVGHSLGELTALVISGVLSLPDGLGLIAARGDSIQKDWGHEKGCMLALECTMDEFAAVSALTVMRSEDTDRGKLSKGEDLDDDATRTPGELEIACFNGPTSLVVSGPENMIATAEEILRTNPKFRAVRFQRLNTSHGFHSAMTEPILATIAGVAKSLQWSEPRIPFYTCSQSGNITCFDDRYASAHAREPVFFHDAIRRIEDDLGPCVWLEAGINTPITQMIRKACRQPEKHVLKPFSTRNRAHHADVVADVVVECWKERIFLNHWGCLGVPSCPALQSRQIWLPPYQFTKTRHWVESVDRVMELKRAHLVEMENMRGAEQTRHVSPKSLPPPLVSNSRQPRDTGNGYAEFIIHPENPRYRSVVGGHIVCSRPLCPAPLYMECAVAAMHLLLGNEGDAAAAKDSTSNLVFDNFNVRSPLGLEPQGEVLLRLQQVPGARRAWRLNVVSREGPSSETFHADGVISYEADTTGMLEGFQRLVAAQMQRLVSSSDTEKLQCDRAYKLFERVVEYSPCFKGIQSVQIGADEAVATVKLPETQPHLGDDVRVTSWKICDAVAVDAAVHVVGLLINTSVAMSSKDVAVMVGIHRTVISPAFSADAGSAWTVYASFSCAKDPQQPIGDVFVCSADGQLVAMFTGCAMTKLPVTRVEKMFDKAFSTARNTKAGTAGPEALTFSKSLDRESTRTETSRKMDTPTTGTQSSGPAGQHANSSTIAVLRDLVAECTGLDSSDIPTDSSLGIMGLDSLGSAELAEELHTKFGLTISSTGLLDITLLQLQQLVGLEGPGGTMETKPSAQRDLLLDPGCSESTRNFRDSSEPETASNYTKLLNILAEVSGARPEDIEPDTTLIDLGADSLSMIDLKQSIEESFSTGSLDLNMDDSVQKIMSQLGIAASPGSTSWAPRPEEAQHNSRLAVETGKSSLLQTNPFDALAALTSEFDAAASLHGVATYWTEIAPLQDDITLGYIVEGFAGLGVDLRGLSEGEQVPPVPHLSPKYDKLMRRLWEILEKRSIISTPPGSSEQRNRYTVTRGSARIGGKSASQLLEEFGTRFPLYRNETDLIHLTGPRLADCLSGRIDSVALMFGSPRSLKIMEDYYGCSPISSTLSAQLSIFLQAVLSRRSEIQGRPVRILEVGGGTGGTTRWVASSLERAGVATEYTFTDISPTLVRKAKMRFAPQYPWMKYTTFNLESDVQPEFQGKFDIVIATNTVHATTDRTASCRRMRETLSTAGGLVILAELTCHIDWCDICFGLLDGWWLADGPIAPLQTAQEWMDTFSDAGFKSMGYSSGKTAGANTAQLLVGCNMPWEMPITGSTLPENVAAVGGHRQVPLVGEEKKNKGEFRLKTMVYKEVDGVQIQADVYVPKQASLSPMPIGM